MALPQPSAIRAREIEQRDIPHVSSLLAEGFPSRDHAFWLKVFGTLARDAGAPELPTYGYLLEGHEGLLGALITIFSVWGGGVAPKTRCNVSSWYVKPPFRTYASLLAARAFKRKDVTYLNVTPAPHTLPILRAQGYVQYNEGAFVTVAALQRSLTRTQIAVLPRDGIPAGIEPQERRLLCEHAQFGCITLWCTSAARSFPLVFRSRRFKGVLGCAQLVYCRHVDDFVGVAGPVGRFLALQGSPLVLLDCNGPVSGLIGKYFPARMPKFFKGPDRPRLGDLAYTETALFGF